MILAVGPPFKNGYLQIGAENIVQIDSCFDPCGCLDDFSSEHHIGVGIVVKLFPRRANEFPVNGDL